MYRPSKRPTLPSLQRQLQLQGLAILALESQVAKLTESLSSALMAMELSSAHPDGDGQDALREELRRCVPDDVWHNPDLTA